MLHLMKLEFKKWKVSSLIISIFITLVITILLVLPPLYFDTASAPKDAINLLQAVDSIIRVSFIIFSGVILARYVTDEYADRTMQLMFTYPISRKKILISKLILVIGITFISILATRVIMYSLISGIDSVSPFLAVRMTDGLTGTYLTYSTVYDLAASALCLIALYFGMWRKSSKVTIITAILTAILISGNFGDISLGGSFTAPLFFSLVGVTFAAFTIHNIETKDFI